MSLISIFCIANTRDQAKQIVARLKGAGFSNYDISVLFPDKATTRDSTQDKNPKTPEGMVTLADGGGVMYGTLGWLAGIGALAVPGAGPFIAAGPVFAALSGAAVGADAGCITRCFIGLGIPEKEAKRFENKLLKGNLLLSVHTESSEEIKQAWKIFKDVGAQDICITGESALPQAPKPSSLVNS